MTLTGRSRLAGVLGWPVTHSRSPRLHGYWLDRHGIDGAYVPLPVAPDDLVDGVRALPRLGFLGANVTVPHKQAVLGACDRLDDHARRLGAVNTLLFDGHSVEGRNTDGVGFLNNLRQGAPNWDPTAGPAVVLGAGGAARAVVVALTDAGVPEVRIANRTRDKADALADDLGGPITAVDWQAREHALAGANLLVNTTSLGMAGHDPARDRPVGPAGWRAGQRHRLPAAGDRPAGPGPGARELGSWTASACCCTKPCRASRRGSAYARR